MANIFLSCYSIVHVGVLDLSHCPPPLIQMAWGTLRQRQNKCGHDPMDAMSSNISMLISKLTKFILMFTSYFFQQHRVVVMQDVTREQAMLF